MKPTWTLAALGFVTGTLVGALGYGQLFASAEVPAVSSGTTAADSAPAVAAPPASAPPASASVAKVTAASAPGVPSAPVVAAPREPTADPRVATLLAAWRNAEARLADLQARLVQVEQTLAGRIAAGDTGLDRPTAPRTPDERRTTLVAAGVDAGLADDIIWQEARLELDRLTLRDRAVREGWIGTDRYREASGQLGGEPRPLREEIGDRAYDRYLYLTGEDNRVAVAAVIPGSAAEAAGLQAGDLIESYAGERMYAADALRDGTTQGESGELVPVRVRRGRGIVEAWVPRGPLGIRLDMTRAEPLP
jgi:membrane-associated protease RseP (regulator of RpoE activity)